jgi:hypothetical protein
MEVGVANLSCAGEKKVYGIGGKRTTSLAASGVDESVMM